MSDEFEDGPLFRATLQDLETQTSNLKSSLKKCMKSCINYVESMRTAQQAHSDFISQIESIPILHKDLVNYLRESQHIISNANEKTLSQIETLLMDPLNQMYETKIKNFEGLKREFDQESTDYYAYQVTFY